MEDQPGMESLSKEASTSRRDPTYYIDDGNVVILVENALFKVHRWFLTAL
jgi:hypothetical protein